MTRRLCWLATAISALLLVGCAPPPAGAPEVLAARTADEPFTRTDGPVLVAPVGTSWLATQQIVIQGHGDAIAVLEALLSTGLGEVLVVPRAHSGYGITVHLKASGSSESSARAALASLEVSHADNGGSPRVIRTQVQRLGHAPPDPGPVSLGLRGSDIVAELPVTAVHRLQAESALGDITVRGLSGERAQLSSALGNVALDGQWRDATLETNLGDTDFAGYAERFTALSDLGTLRGEFLPLASAEIQMQTNLGSIQLALPSTTGAGFDLFAQTNLGSAVIAVAGTEPAGSPGGREAHWRTPDYEARQIQVRAITGSDLGSILIHD